jgi:hypothetical protein
MNNNIKIKGKIMKEVEQPGDSVSIVTRLWTGQTSNHSSRIQKKVSLSSEVYRQTEAHPNFYSMGLAP